MIVINIVTEEIANKILENFCPPFKDYLVCQYIDKLPDYLLKRLTKKFYVITTDEYHFNPDFLIVPKSIESTAQFESDVQHVDLVITTISREFEDAPDKLEDETLSDYLAKVDDFRLNLHVQVMLENVKRVIYVSNEIQNITVETLHEESDIFE